MSDFSDAVDEAKEVITAARKNLPKKENRGVLLLFFGTLIALGLYNRAYPEPQQAEHNNPLGKEKRFEKFITATEETGNTKEEKKTAQPFTP